MSPAVRLRLWTAFHAAALQEHQGSSRRARYKSLCGMVAYGAGMRTLGRSIDRLTHPSAALVARLDATPTNRLMSP